jgi:hypothetical protein
VRERERGWARRERQKHTSTRDVGSERRRETNEHRRGREHGHWRVRAVGSRKHSGSVERSTPVFKVRACARVRVGRKSLSGDWRAAGASVRLQPRGLASVVRKIAGGAGRQNYVQQWCLMTKKRPPLLRLCPKETLKCW